jgi:hypothetical protein
LRILESEQAGRQVAGFEINAARTSGPAAFLVCPSILEDGPAVVVGYHRGASLKRKR